MPHAGSDRGDVIEDDEIVYRRVPRQPPFHTPEEWLSTANFSVDLRRHEMGISVYRSRYQSAQDVLRHPAAVPGSFLVSARVGEIRLLKDGVGQPLNLDVRPADDDGTNSRHAEIRGPTPARLSRAARKALRDLFARSRIDG